MAERGRPFIPGVRHNPNLRAELIPEQDQDQNSTITWGELDEVLIHSYTQHGGTREQALEAIRQSGSKLPTEASGQPADALYTLPSGMVRVTSTRRLRRPPKKT